MKLNINLVINVEHVKKEMNGDFVQLYTVRLRLANSYKYYELCNGFNYVHDYVEVRWVDIRKENEFIPKDKDVYISVWFPVHQKIAIRWARKYPSNTFTLGGPLYQNHEFKYKDMDLPYVLPHNIKIQTGLVEEMLGVPVDHKNWKLNFPYNQYKFQYSYYIGSRCYWRGCSFCCNARYVDYDIRNGYDLETLYNAPKGTVFLSTPAILPSMLKDILPNLNYKNKGYFLYLRAGKKELESLKKIVNKIERPDRIIFGLGVEFPSDRMLRVMNKGITLQEYIDMILFLKETGFRFNCLYITYWPEIEEEDLKDARYFFKSIGHCKRANHFYTKMYESYEISPNQNIVSNTKMTFVDGYNNQNSDKNDEYIRILKEYGVIDRQERIQKVPLYDPILYKKYILPLDK